jgi:hypothetical protein
MMSEDGQLARIGKTPELLDVIAKNGDRAMDFVWRNKKSLSMAVGLRSFLRDPHSFLNGSSDITIVAAENPRKEMAESPCQVAYMAGRDVDWSVVVTVSALIAALSAAGGMWLKRRGGFVKVRTL